MEEKRSTELTFTTIGLAFSQNLSSVRVLGSEIAQAGDEHDRKVVDEFFHQLKTVIPELDSPEASTPSENLELDVRAAEPHTKEADPPEGGLQLDLREARAVLRAIQSFNRRWPVQGTLLRNGSVVTLVSFFEALVSDLLHLYFKKYPAALPADNRALSLADLRALGSVTD